MTTLQTLAPHMKDLGGGFMVRRLLPAADRRSVGPFVFFDHFGPVEVVAPGSSHDVRPHPHIGLSTLTYLFDGAMMHRDSTGVVQRIEPGAVNWMSAGRGIVHSERVPKDLQQSTYRSHGLQLWVALPEADEESAPSFQHAPAASIPQVRLEGATVQVVVGTAFGAASPIATRSPTLALVFDFDAASGKAVELPALASERALYAVDHPFEIDGEKIDEFTMVVAARGRDAQAGGAARRPGGAGRRRAARPSLHLLELRLQPARTHPRRRGRLGGTALRPHPRRDRVHPAADAPPLSRRAAESAGRSISTLPMAASPRPESVSRSGRKPSTSSETRSASSGVITPTVPAGPGPSRSCSVRKQAKASTEPASASQASDSHQLGAVGSAKSRPRTRPTIAAAAAP